MSADIAVCFPELSFHQLYVVPLGVKGQYTCSDAGLLSIKSGNDINDFRMSRIPPELFYFFFS